ncbi:MAG: hypothetical protein TEF_06720 [Rhizobiales bacterium NRL2]|nr:MAG: hypothetical protein TEF_06720 [Rhizobiales bacterium NRL2]
MSEIGADSRDRITGEDRRRIGGRFGAGRIVRKSWKPLLIAVAIFALLYYPIGMALVHDIDDDLDFNTAPEALSEGQSHAVQTVVRLIEREIDENAWTPNDPWFYPSAGLDNMPNYQLGIVSALSRFGVELLDEIGRVRGSSGADPDLQNAAGRLKISGEKWTWDPAVSIWPQTAAESEYRSAVQSLRLYNDRLANGNAVFDRRADNLQVVIERVANDLGSASQAIDDHVREHAGGWWFDYQVDDEFYRIKGKAYAYYLVMRDLGRDFDGLIAERNLTRPWNELIGSMRYLAGLDPLVVLNGSPDGLIFPNHLATQGFYLLRVRTKLKEVSNILLK